jgi:ABC-type iron transport system FetAB ATPase subunit
MEHLWSFYLQAITIKNLFVESKGVKILQVEDFKIAPGTICYIDGHSGSGKSIFFKSLIRLLPIQYAHYTLMDKDVSAFSPEELRVKLMYLNQQPMLPLGKVSDFLALVSTFVHHKKDRLNIANSFCQFLNKLDRDKDFLHLDNSNLSGGETQILQLCLALVLCKDTLILDEAFSAMDRTTHYKAEELVLNWLQEKKNKRSIIFTSHQPELSLLKPDIVYCMSRGLLQLQGP